jgi:hypothetical protein
MGGGHGRALAAAPGQTAQIHPFAKAKCASLECGFTKFSGICSLSCKIVSGDASSGDGGDCPALLHLYDRNPGRRGRVLYLSSPEVFRINRVRVWRREMTDLAAVRQVRARRPASPRIRALPRWCAAAGGCALPGCRGPVRLLAPDGWPLAARATALASLIKHLASTSAEQKEIGEAMSTQIERLIEIGVRRFVPSPCSSF